MKKEKWLVCCANEEAIFKPRNCVAVMDVGLSPHWIPAVFDNTRPTKSYTLKRTKKGRINYMGTPTSKRPQNYTLDVERG